MTYIPNLATDSTGAYIGRGEDGQYWRRLASGNVALAYPHPDGTDRVVSIYDGYEWRERFGL